MTRRRLTFENRLFLFALAAGAPAVAAAVVLLMRRHASSGTVWIAGSAMVAWWIGLAAALKERFAYSMRTLSNLLGAVRDGDFSFRLRMDDRGSLGEVYRQINDMSATLHEQRLGAMEAAALLQKVMGEIDVAIFAFDSAGMLRLINRAGEQLLRMKVEEAMGKSAEELGLEPYLTGPASSVVRASFRGGAGLWSVRRGDFRESGQPHRLLVLSDITRPLREEELQAWQKLVRVLGHEINNSLTPVKSLSASLLSLVDRDPPPEDWRGDVHAGLTVIANRCEALNRFTGAYARLARLPEPKLQSVRVGDWVARVVRLETRVAVRVRTGPDIVIRADPDQLDQLLINILRNAADASIERHGGVAIAWRLDRGALELTIDDEGHGITNPANLFVPFFTTKRGGSGIGLVLSRQITEAHNGSLMLRNAPDGPGCVATLTLPI